MKVFVDVPEPRVSVAVRVTCAGSEPAPGRVTTPVLLMVAGALEAQLIAEPKEPAVGSARLAVTPDRSPRPRASVSEDSRLASVSEMSATSEAVSARS